LIIVNSISEYMNEYVKLYRQTLALSTEKISEESDFINACEAKL